MLGHTSDTKVVISVPDGVFEQAEQIAKRLRVSRSRLYSAALQEFLKKLRGTTVREALDAVYRRKPSSTDRVLTELQARALHERW